MRTLRVPPTSARGFSLAPGSPKPPPDPCVLQGDVGFQHAHCSATDICLDISSFLKSIVWGVTVHTLHRVGLACSHSLICRSALDGSSFIN